MAIRSSSIDQYRQNRQQAGFPTQTETQPTATSSPFQTPVNSPTTSGDLPFNPGIQQGQSMYDYTNQRRQESGMSILTPEQYAQAQRPGGEYYNDGVNGGGYYSGGIPTPTPTQSSGGNGFDLLKQYQQQNPFAYGQSSATGVVDWLKSQGVNASYVDHRGQPSADKIWVDGKMYDIIGSSDDPNKAHWSTHDVTADHYAAQSGGGSTGGAMGGGTAGFQKFNVLDPRFNSLYNTLLNRSNQSLAINGKDPIIRNQVDNYRAEQTRGVRDYLAQQAESQGPNANLNSERRLANEGAAQATGSLQASLIQNELTARRNEIMAALSQMGGMLSDQQRIALQQQLGMIDANLRQQSINSGNDQFLADLGLRAANQANYWNSIYSGF